jgi:hypothetical protein
MAPRLKESSRRARPHLDEILAGGNMACDPIDHGGKRLITRPHKAT